MRLPNAERAFVDNEKLLAYCLSPQHPRGKHKARVFASALGFTQEHSELFRRAILEAALREQATFTGADEYGRRYVLDVSLTGPAGTATVRTCWIIRSGEAYPRLTTCYVRG